MQSIINDWAITVATVNGSGSQSANSILFKSLFRMGIPVGAKNLFPSNISGLPTWYTIRANHKGYTARKHDLDIVVAMNPATWLEDMKSVNKGGVLVYNSDFPAATGIRDDIVAYPVPFKKIAEENFTEIKLRRLLTNMIYVGFLAEMLSLDLKVIEGVVNDQFKSKAKVVESNMKALELGVKYFKENVQKKDRFKAEKMDGTAGKILIDGNSAAALGCLYGGCTVTAWYPITPSSSLCESLIDLYNEHRVSADGTKKFAVVQAEDELAAAGMVFGAGWAGARAMTATSGPGISLMAEFIGLGYFTEIPGVFFDVQRVGPSTGLPTRTMQGDLEFVANLSHGDTQHPVLLPANPVDCFDMSAQAFDLAERLQTPVFVLSDLDLGMNNWLSDKFTIPEKPFDRGKVLNAEQLEKAGKFERYRDLDGDGIPYRTLPGTHHKLASYFTRGSGHNEKAQYTEKPEDYVNLVDRLKKKFETAKGLVPKPIRVDESGAKVGIIAYGSTDLAMQEIRDLLKEQNIKTSYLRIKAFPFNSDVKKFISDFDRVYVVEQNRDGQMARLLTLDFPELATRLKSIRVYNGLPIEAQDVSGQILVKERGNA